MKQIIHTDAAPAAIGPYAQAVQAGGFVYLSGQIGLDPKTGEFAGDTVAAQAKQALENIKAVLDAASCTLNDVVKTTVFLKDMRDFVEMNDVYAAYFTFGAYPARSAVEVAALPKGALVEIEVVAKAE